MTQRVLGESGTARRRWTLLLVLLPVIALGLMVVAGASAQLDKTLFELDKGASVDSTFTNGAGTPGKIGVLNAAVANEAGPTTITICQDLSAFYNGEKILVNAERMTLADGANASGGGCPSGFSNKRSYSASRGVDGTSPGAHAKAEDVSRFGAATPSSHDWNEVYKEVDADPSSTCASLGAVECAFLHDGRAMSVFTQSKDYDEISDDAGATVYWKWRNQSVPDADELDDGMAIKYIDGDGDQQIFVAADRFAVNGTKDTGIWLFHDEVTSGGGADGGDNTFTGVHTAPDPGANGVFCKQADGGNVPGGQGGPTPACSYDNDDTAGDVFLLSSFSGGGAVVTIRVFEWIGPAGSVAALLQRGVAADCVPGNPSQQLCSTVNNTTIESGTFGDGLWPYQGKGEPVANEIAAGGLFEGGINLSDLGLEGCFSSIMWATRSSDAVNADPKDFILGSFEACDSDLTTTPKNGTGGALTADSDNDNLDEITIGTDGTVDVTDSAVLDVQGTTSFTGSLTFYLCGPIDNPAACDDGGFQAGFTTPGNPVTSNGTYTSDAVTLTSVGRYCWFASFDSNTDGVPDASDATIESGDGTGECFEVLPVTPSLSTTAWSNDGSGDGGSAQTTAVPFGDPVYDRATLSGTAKAPGDNGSNTTYPTIEATNGADADGTITFTLKKDDCSTNAGGTGSNPEDVSVSGDDDYFTSGFTPDAPGDYSWQAVYTGDSPNTNGVSHNDGNDGSTACSFGDEDVTVEQIPTAISTSQFFYPNDSATVSTDDGSALPSGGQVVFSAYTGTVDATVLANCQAGGSTGRLFTETVAISGASGSSASTTNTSNAVPPATIVYWNVEYLPNSSAYEGRESVCVETTTLDITDDSGPGTVPSS